MNTCYLASCVLRYQVQCCSNCRKPKLHHLILWSSYSASMTQENVLWSAQVQTLHTWNWEMAFVLFNSAWLPLAPSTLIIRTCISSALVSKYCLVFPFPFPLAGLSCFQPYFLPCICSVFERTLAWTSASWSSVFGSMLRNDNWYPWEQLKLEVFESRHCKTTLG